MAITNASSNAPADPADGFHLMRPELDIAHWQVELYGAFHGDFMMRLWAYRLQEPDPSGTNKFLFERDEHRDFPLAARYFLNELCETVGRGRRRFACPLPEGTYNPNRYVDVSAPMLASILNAMEKYGDLVKLPGGGRERRGGRHGSYTATVWQMQDQLFDLVCRQVCDDAQQHPYILMRTSWHNLSEADQDAFRDAWLNRELRQGRDGDTYKPIYRELGRNPQTGNIVREKVRDELVRNPDGSHHVPTPSEWKARWDDADWYAQAAGRRMTADEAGVADMLVSLGRTNAFTAQHAWRDGAGHLEPAPCRMSHRVFRDDNLHEHGRFYYPDQAIKKEYLNRFTVNGEQTDTGDIVCTHPSILLGLEGRKSIYDAPYDGDIYAYYAGLDLADPTALRASLLAAVGNQTVDAATVGALMAAPVLRQQWKRAFSICLNARNGLSAVMALAQIVEGDSSAGQLCPPGALLQRRNVMDKPFWSRQRIQDVVDTLVADPVFGGSMCTGQGPRLMYLDASWMEAVRHRLEDAGIPYRDIHDSVTCPVSRIDEVDAIMKDEWQERFGYAPAVKWTKRDASA